ncbi:hypothetical protein DY467_14890 [Rhodopseudomonas sp. BR0G17]|nr:hypothetical protein [Rhodopseudomonas sp. BR0G17]
MEFGSGPQAVQGMTPAGTKERNATDHMGRQVIGRARPLDGGGSTAILQATRRWGATTIRYQFVSFCQTPDRGTMWINSQDQRS